MADDDPRDISCSLLHSFVAICAKARWERNQVDSWQLSLSRVRRAAAGRFTVRLLFSQSENFIFLSDVTRRWNIGKAIFVGQASRDLVVALSRPEEEEGSGSIFLLFSWKWTVNVTSDSSSSTPPCKQPPLTGWCGSPICQSSTCKVESPWNIGTFKWGAQTTPILALAVRHLTRRYLTRRQIIKDFLIITLNFARSARLWAEYPSP